MGFTKAASIPNLTRHLFHSYISVTFCKYKNKKMPIIKIKSKYYLGGMGSLLAKVSLDCL